MRLGGLVSSAFALAVLAAAPASAATYDMHVRDFAFVNPVDGSSTITITQGDSVTWIFDSPNHSVTSDSNGQSSFDSDQNVLTPNHAPPNDKFSWTFTIPDDSGYTYHCKVHPSMTGKVVVLPKTNNPNPPPEDVIGPKFGTPRVSVAKRRVKFTLDESAQVTGKLAGPTRKKLTLAGKAGNNVLKLPKRMKPGRYSLKLTATDPAGNTSTTVRVKFRVPKPKR
jgi:plastocyanin